MEWSTFQLRGEWLGEWQCRSERCEGNHTAPALPTGVPVLWTRAAVPIDAYPMCHCCRGQRLQPLLCHAPGSQLDSSWHANWNCYACGPTPAMAIDCAMAGALTFIAQTLTSEQWNDAASQSTAHGFWTAVREYARAATRTTSRPGYTSAGLPPHRIGATFSAIYVPLLLDAANLLPSAAQAAWRSHATAGSSWSRWVQTLRDSARQPLTILAVALRNQFEAQP